MFASVAGVYADAGDTCLSNEDLYQQVAERANIPDGRLDERVPIGASGQRHSVLKRAIRWHQQTLKHMGVIERDGARGVWRLMDTNKRGLHEAIAGVRLVAFSTKLGVAVWGDCHDIFRNLGEPITLCVTSPPYPLAKARAYGGPSEAEYVDFIVRALEPIVRHMAADASLCLNVSNDIFVAREPSRSMYCERLVLALHDKLGLSLMDRLVWSNPSKPPGPVQWSSLKRVQLNVGYEPIYWFAVDPLKVKSDNRRVLEQHTERHLRLLEKGGTSREACYSDGAYRLHPGRFGKPTVGRIPKNVLTRGHFCQDANKYRRDARELGLPVHGAMWPLSIPDFLVRFLSDVGDLVVDPFGGRVTTGMAAERNGRRWLVAERVLDYARGGAERFRECEGFNMPEMIEAWPRQRVAAGAVA
ncbi:MAG: site-specific DNA-methyltransferase [Rhodanobacteraceae bacterium]|nr:MAG: site-specific DNA-methyltransferase [Rhodanobacteraceae bacterium]